MRVILLMLLLTGWANGASAQTTYSLDPPQGRNGGIVNLRVADPSGCFHADLPAVVRDGNTVKVSFEILDFIPPDTPPRTCPPERVTPQSHSLGTFTTGNYLVEVSTCSFNAPVPPFCTAQATLNLSVFGASGTSVVPATNWPALLLLAIALSAAAIRLRSR